jgi:YD repeat-containing protein
VIYSYDTLNRLVSETDALGHVWSYTYDGANRLSTKTDPKSQVTTLSYNNRGDVSSIDYPAGTPDVALTYDDVRRRTQMVDGTGTTTYNYDAVNRLTSVTFPRSRTVGYTYSNVGNRATVTHLGSRTVTYSYDEANNLTSVTDWNSQQTAYAYDNAGRLTTATLPSGTGIVVTMSYDNADRLTGISWDKGGTTLASASYTLDAAGSRTQRVDQAGTHSYSYDALYRLTSVTYPDPVTDSFTYDAVGNRLSRNSTTYTYDAADRIVSVGSTSYKYDNNGNLTARGSDSFSWDAADRLASATVAGTTTTFAYNGDGLRDSFTTGGVTTTTTWDIAGGLPVELYDGAFSYVYGVGRISEIDGSGNTYYYLPDALASTMALCDAGGKVKGISSASS